MNKPEIRDIHKLELNIRARKLNIDSLEEHNHRVYFELGHPVYSEEETLKLENERLGYLEEILALIQYDDWQIIINDLINRAKNGRDSVYRILKDLKAAKYIKLEKINEPGTGYIKFTYHVYEVPYEEADPTKDNTRKSFTKNNLPHPEYPHTVKPLTDLPHEDNTTLLNTNLNKTDYIKTEQTEEELYLDRMFDEAENLPEIKSPVSVSAVLINKKESEEITKPLDCEEYLIDDLIALQEDDPMNNKTASRLITEYGKEKVRHYLLLLSQRIENGSNIPKPVGWLINTLKENKYTILTSNELLTVNVPAPPKERDTTYDKLFSFCNKMLIEPEAMTDSMKKTYISDWILQKYYLNFTKDGLSSSADENTKKIAVEFFKDVKACLPDFNTLKFMIESSADGSRSYTKSWVVKEFLDYYQGKRVVRV